MPRAKKVVPVDDAKFFDIDSQDAGAEMQPVSEVDAYQLAALAATQLTVTPHDSNDIIDLRIDRALFIAGKLLAKAKEVQ